MEESLRQKFKFISLKENYKPLSKLLVDSMPIRNVNLLETLDEKEKYYNG